MTQHFGRTTLYAPGAPFDLEEAAHLCLREHLAGWMYPPDRIDEAAQDAVLSAAAELSIDGVLRPAVQLVGSGVLVRAARVDEGWLVVALVPDGVKPEVRLVRTEEQSR